MKIVSKIRMGILNKLLIELKNRIVEINDRIIIFVYSAKKISANHPPI